MSFIRTTHRAEITPSSTKHMYGVGSGMEFSVEGAGVVDDGGRKMAMKKSRLRMYVLLCGAVGYWYFVVRRVGKGGRLTATMLLPPP